MKYNQMNEMNAVMMIWLTFLLSVLAHVANTQTTYGMYKFGASESTHSHHESASIPIIHRIGPVADLNATAWKIWATGLLIERHMHLASLEPKSGPTGAALTITMKGLGFQSAPSELLRFLEQERSGHGKINNSAPPVSGGPVLPEEWISSSSLNSDFVEVGVLNVPTPALSVHVDVIDGRYLTVSPQSVSDNSVTFLIPPLFQNHEPSVASTSSYRLGREPYNSDVTTSEVPLTRRLAAENVDPSVTTREQGEIDSFHLALISLHFYEYPVYRGKNPLPLRIYPAPRINRIHPSSVALAGGESVMLYGLGLFASDVIQTRFYSSTHERVVHCEFVVIPGEGGGGADVPAIMCRAPQWFVEEDVELSLSFNGQQFHRAIASNGQRIHLAFVEASSLLGAVAKGVVERERESGSVLQASQNYSSSGASSVQETRDRLNNTVTVASAVNDSRLKANIAQLPGGELGPVPANGGAIAFRVVSTKPTGGGDNGDTNGDKPSRLDGPEDDNDLQVVLPPKARSSDANSAIEAKGILVVDEVASHELPAGSGGTVEVPVTGVDVPLNISGVDNAAAPQEYMDSVAGGAARIADGARHIVLSSLGSRKDLLTVHLEDDQRNNYVLSKPFDTQLLRQDLRYLSDLVILVLAATSGGLVAEFFHVPALVGYVVGGMAVGPRVLDKIQQLVQVFSLGQLGSILLLFDLGWHLSLQKIVKVKISAITCGMVASLLMILLFTGIAVIRSTSLSESLIFGCYLAMSSTALCGRAAFTQGQSMAANEVNEADVVIGVLLVQDVILGFILTLLPTFSPSGPLTAKRPDSYSLLVVVGSFVRLTLGIVVIALGCVLLAIGVVSPLGSHLVRKYSRSALLLSTLSLALAIAWLADQLGLSMELGAFAAGLAVAARVRPEDLNELVNAFDGPRRLWEALYFASIGLMVDPVFIWDNLAEVSGVLLLLLAVKAIVLLLCMLSCGFDWRYSVRISFILMNIGEFGFVVLSKAASLGMIGRKVHLLLLGSTSISLAITPVMLKLLMWLPTPKTVSLDSGQACVVSAVARRAWRMWKRWAPPTNLTESVGVSVEPAEPVGRLRSKFCSSVVVQTIASAAGLSKSFHRETVYERLTDEDGPATECGVIVERGAGARVEKSFELAHGGATA